MTLHQATLTLQDSAALWSISVASHQAVLSPPIALGPQCQSRRSGWGHGYRRTKRREACYRLGRRSHHLLHQALLGDIAEAQSANLTWDCDLGRIVTRKPRAAACPRAGPGR